MENKNYLDTDFQFYKNGIGTTKPSGTLTLRQFINATISPKPSLLKGFKDIQTAAEQGDIKKKDRLKQSILFFTTPSVIVGESRSYSEIKKFNPFLILEFDKILHPELMRDYIFDKFESCIFAFCSPSLTGSKFLFRIPEVSSVDEYKEYFWGIAFELDKFVGLDYSNQNPVLPLFISHDKNAKFREDAVESVARGYNVTAFDASNIVSEVNIEGTCSEEQAEKCFALIRNMINGIENEGHPIILKSSTALGGFCAYYDIDTDLAWDVLEELIRDNEYLSKNIIGYLKTARLMFSKGQYSPFPLNSDKN